MGGARALIASLGASISLVAGAALSLLLMSVVVAYPGFIGGDDGPGASAALVIAEQSPAAIAPSERRARGASDAVVIRAQRRPRTAEPRRAQRAPAKRAGRATSKPSFAPGVRDLTPTAEPAPAQAPPAAPKPAVGDGVRDVGNAVTATVQSTSAAAGAAAAQLLGPPVSQAVQDVLDVLTSVLQGATGGLAGALDKTVPR